MARIKFSPLVTDASGSVGDTVFSKWKGRNYIRTRVDPANPQTVNQQNVRDALTEAVAIWQELSTDLKGAFDDGSSGMKISGYNDFVSRNRSHIQAEDGLYGPRHNPELAAGNPLLPTDVSASTGASTGEIDISWTDPGAEAGDYVGVLVYEPAIDSLVEETLDAALVSSTSYTITGVTGGNTAIIAVMGYDQGNTYIEHAAALAQSAAS